MKCDLNFHLKPIKIGRHKIKQMENPKLLDVFLFYNELDLLKARLEYLGSIVDYFIISEADTDFSGRKKSFLLSSEIIESLPYSNKIIYQQQKIHLNSPSWLFKKLRYFNRKNRLLWKIQDEQRNSTLTPLKKFNPNDIVLFSDLDEFPSESAIQQGVKFLDSRKAINLHPMACSLDQIFFYYNLSNAAPLDKFYGSVMTTLGEFRKYSPHKFRSDKNNFEHIKNGGWHFSYFMDENLILNKIFAISDVENLSRYKNITMGEIQKKILSGADLYDRGTKLDQSEYKNIPDSLIKIIQKYLPNCSKIPSSPSP